MSQEARLFNLTHTKYDLLRALLAATECIINQTYLRQCVIDVFCSTSTERSRKSSSLLLTCQRKKRHEVTQLSSASTESVTISPLCCNRTTHTHTQPVFEMLIKLSSLCVCAVFAGVVQGNPSHSSPSNL